HQNEVPDLDPRSEAPEAAPASEAPAADAGEVIETVSPQVEVVAVDAPAEDLATQVEAALEPEFEVAEAAETELSTEQVVEQPAATEPQASTGTVNVFEVVDGLFEDGDAEPTEAMSSVEVEVK